MNYETLTREMRRLAIEAGVKIMEIYDADRMDVEVKADDSPVTAADKAARDAVQTYLFAILAIVPPTAIAVHYILTRLAALVRDAAAGAAFSLINADRLRTIGWAVLAINIADLAYGWLSIRTSDATGEYFGWSLSLTGWIAVPMLFVLAHVFREGTAMREDLEGTV